IPLPARCPLPPPPLRTFRPVARAGLVLVSAGALTLAFAPRPLGQFYLAWVALAPWMAAVLSARSVRLAMLWGGLGGGLFFGTNLWWLWTASIPGAVLTPLYFALFWALAAAAIRLIRPGPLAVGAVWCATEWLRGLAVGG